MKSGMRLLLFLYAACMYLYPRRYRRDFGDEMQAVFYRAVHEAMQRGGVHYMARSLYEFGSLPYGAFQEHLRQRRMRTPSPTPAWKAALAALVPFLVMGILPNLLRFLPVKLPQWAEVALAILLIEILLGTLAIGLIKRLPDWSLPYWGFMAAILSLMLFNVLIEWVYNPTVGLLDPHGPWLVRALFNEGFLWFGLLLVSLLVILLSAILPPLRPFYFRLRGDWTLLSFAMYGATLLAALVTFDDYSSEEPFVLIAFLILAVAAYAYLSTRSTQKRAAALVCGLLLAGILTALAKIWIYPLQVWPDEVKRSFDASDTIISTLALWGWLLVVMLSPIILRILPPGRPVSSSAASQGIS